MLTGLLSLGTPGALLLSPGGPAQSSTGYRVQGGLATGRKLSGEEAQAGVLSRVGPGHEPASALLHTSHVTLGRLLCISELWFPDKENGDGMLVPLLREWRERQPVESLAQYQAQGLMDRIPIVNLRFPWFFYLLKLSWGPRIWVWKDHGDVYHLIRQQDLIEHYVDRMFTACCGSGSALSLALVNKHITRYSQSSLPLPLHPET